MGICRRVALRLLAPALLASLSLVACEDEIACENAPQPSEGCFDVCSGNPRFPTCVEGQWQCPEQDPHRACESPCGAYPSAPEPCVDFCGQPEILICPGWQNELGGSERSWRCPEPQPQTCGPPAAAEWSLAIAGRDAHAIALDAAGNTFLAGTFQGTLALGNDTLVSPSQDVFVAKLDAEGSVAWARSRGESGDDSVLGLDVDAAGQALLAYARDTIDGQWLSLVKLDATGAELWRHDSDVYANSWPHDTVALDGLGNVVVTGNAVPGTSIGGMPIPGADFFVMRLDASGAPSWVKSFDANGTGMIGAIDLDDAGNVFVTGLYEGIMTFGGSGVVSVDNKESAFVMKLGALGDELWLRSYTDTFGAPSLPSVSALGGGAIVGGAFNTMLHLDDGSDVDTDNVSALVMRLTPGGDIAWTQLYQGATDHSGYETAVDAHGDIVIAADYEGDLSDLFPSGERGGSDLHLAKLDADGERLWQSWLGSPNHERVADVATGPGGRIGLLGEYSGILDLGAGPLSSDAGGLFVASFPADGH